MSLCFFECSVGIWAFVIGPSKISFFFSSCQQMTHNPPHLLFLYFKITTVVSLNGGLYNLDKYTY